ncbi:hypothetical protein EJB05_02395, partial [Eragrostis curvula]
MALVSNGDPRLRVYEPSFSCQFPSAEEESACRSRVLYKIHISYQKALKQLNKVRAAEGLCFGFLDPVSNIVFNTLIPYNKSRPESRRYKREEPVVVVSERKLKELVRRSLDGLVAFLVRFFPDLAECQALRYLLLAEADLLVASRIALSDLGMRRFG